MITYETKNTHPGRLPSATIYMGGLMCLSFDHANKCTVGVNNLVGNGHQWKFSIIDLESPQIPIVLLEQETMIAARKRANLPNPHEIYIDVTGGTTLGTYVYNGGPVLIPSRKEKRRNLESSWVDLEGPRGHNTKVANDANTLWPRFYINEGLFCASKLSSGLFDLRDSNPRPLIKPLGQVALEIVADIFLDMRNPRSKIEVKLPDQTVSLDNQKRYEIFITNECAFPASYVGLAQTDFYLHYNAFSGAFNGRSRMNAADKFNLVHHNAPARDKESARPQTGGDDTDWLTDRAPCMTIALGQTSAFKA